MARFLIESVHEEETTACARAIHLLLSSGSHFITHADWGCEDGDHRGWIIVDVDSREEAIGILPPAYRLHAKVVKLNKFTLEQINAILGQHHG